jgi:hypothetical protein
MLRIDNMPHAIYLADPAPKLIPGTRASLSRGTAVTLLQRTPLHAWTEHPKLNPAYMADEDRKFDLGTAAHKVLLEGWAKDFTNPEEMGIEVLHFDDYRKKDAQEIRDGALAAGRLPVLDHQWIDVVKMVRAARRFLESSKELDWIMKKGTAESTMIWTDHNGSVCRIRPDWIPDDRSLILDYKTTEASAEPGAWSKWIMGATGADVQAAFYGRGLEEETKKPGKFIFLVQEAKPPYACSAIGLNPAEIALADDKVEAASQLWKRCLDANNWPAYPPRVHWIERPAFVEAEWQEKKGYMLDIMFPQVVKHGV